MIDSPIASGNSVVRYVLTIRIGLLDSGHSQYGMPLACVKESVGYNIELHGCTSCLTVLFWDLDGLA